MPLESIRVPTVNFKNLVDVISLGLWSAERRAWAVLTLILVSIPASSILNRELKVVVLMDYTAEDP